MNVPRVIRLMREAVQRLEVDLSGLTVYTEAGTGNYACTPVLAALAGAGRVFALSRDSRFGTAEEAFATMEALRGAVGAANVIVKVREKCPEDLREADIVTNLGHVRPIDAETIANLDASRAVIPYMCEAWEIRPGDVDLEECRRKGIPVMGTNEEHWAVDCFSSCGNLAVKMLYEVGLEVRNNKIAVISNDKFGNVIQEAVAAAGAEARLFGAPETIIGSDWAVVLDAIILADYLAEDTIIGEAGRLKTVDIASQFPGVTIIQFAGDCDVEALNSLGVRVFPQAWIGARRMARALDFLGPKPLVDLMTAGLKVGELMVRERQLSSRQATAWEFERRVFKNVRWGSLTQLLLHINVTQEEGAC